MKHSELPPEIIDLLFNRYGNTYKIYHFWQRSGDYYVGGAVNDNLMFWEVLPEGNVYLSKPNNWHLIENNIIYNVLEKSVTRGNLP